MLFFSIRQSIYSPLITYTLIQSKSLRAHTYQLVKKLSLLPVHLSLTFCCKLKMAKVNSRTCNKNANTDVNTICIHYHLMTWIFILRLALTITLSLRDLFTIQI